MAISSLEMAAKLKEVFAALDLRGTGKMHRDGLHQILTTLTGLAPGDAKAMLDSFCGGHTFVDYGRFFDYCAGEETSAADEVLDWTFVKWLRAPRVAELLAGFFERLGPGSDLEVARRLAGQLTCSGDLLRLLQGSRVLEKLADYWFEQLKALVGGVAVHVDEYNSKFNGFQLAFGDMSKFHRGLDDVVGLPSSKLDVAMRHEHCGCEDSQAVFETSSYGVRTTSATEWHFVVSPEQWQGPGPWPHEDERKLAKEKWRRAPESFHLDTVMATLNGELELQNLVPLMQVECVGARLYTGPMFMKYNAVLRGKSSQIQVLRHAFSDLCKGNEYTSTLHVINSCLIKLSGLTKVERVYRGLSGGKLPEQFTKCDTFKARGGIETAFMSTTLDRSVALQYAAGGGAQAGVVIEMQQGLTDRGADLSRLSQYPHEREICFPPLCGLQLLDTRVEDGVVVATTRASVNMKALTIDRVLGQRRQLLLDVAQHETRVLIKELKDAGIEAEVQALIEKVCLAVVDDVTALAPDVCNNTGFFKDRLVDTFDCTDMLRKALVDGSDGEMHRKLRELLPTWQQVTTTTTDRCRIPVGIFGNSEMLARHLGVAFSGAHVIFELSDGDSVKALQCFVSIRQVEIRDLRNRHSEHTRDWLEALPKLTSLQHLDLAWKFLGPEWCDKLAEALLPLSSLQQLDLAGNNMSAEGLAKLGEALRRLPALQHLDLRHNALGPEGCLALAEALPRLPALQHLDLAENSLGPGGCERLAEALQHVPALLHLSLFRNNLGADGCSKLAKALPQLSQLQHLNLVENDIRAEGCANLAEALRLTSSLQQLYLDRNYICDEGCSKLAEALPRQRRLQQLGLGDNDIGAEGSARLAEALPHLPSLQHLNLAMNFLGAEDCAKLIEAVPQPAPLQRLVLDKNSIGAEGWPALAEALPRLTSLKHLDLGRNDLGATCCGPLAEALPQLLSVEHLVFAQNDIGPEGCAKLAEAVPKMSSLLFLDLRANKVLHEGCMKLAEALSQPSPLRHLNLKENVIAPEDAATLAQAWAPRPREDLHLD